MSNLKQIGLGLRMYTQDYDEKYPPVYNYYTPDTLVWWVDVTQPYIKSRQIFICPSASKPSTYGSYRTDVGALGYPPVLETSYAANSSVMNSTDGTSLAAFDKPSTTILVSEITTNATQMYKEYCDDPTTPGWHGATSVRIDKRHLDGANFLWADGHVKWLKQTQWQEWTLAGG